MAEITEYQVRVIVGEELEKRMAASYLDSTETTNRLSNSISMLVLKLETLSEKLQTTVENFRRHDFMPLQGRIAALELVNSHRKGGLQSWHVIVGLIFALVAAGCSLITVYVLLAR